MGPAYAPVIVRDAKRKMAAPPGRCQGGAAATDAMALSGQEPVLPNPPCLDVVATTTPVAIANTSYLANTTCAMRSPWTIVSGPLPPFWTGTIHSSGKSESTVPGALAM